MKVTIAGGSKSPAITAFASRAAIMVAATVVVVLVVVMAVRGEVLGGVI